uniref:Uncharacterized protein n=1 Tax=Vibrio phage P018-4 TaxID=3229728 RepID=A0AB39AJY7_9CAUD
MKPLGRKYYKDKSGGKHHIRVDGKYECWWDEVCQPNKALEKRRVQQEIGEGEELYYALIEDDLDDECGGWENR